MQPLAKYRVLSLGQAWAAPYADMMLADMGADVVKLEPPGAGDHVRKWSRGDLHGASPHFIAVNRNKRGIVVDLKTERGRAIAADLAGAADVLIENFSPGTLDRLGLGHEALRARHPRLVYCSVSGFGSTGPYAGCAAYDLVMQAESGFISVTGSESGEPAKVGVPAIDVMAGMVAAYTIVCALMERDRTGAGRFLDLSMLEAATSVMGFNLVAHAISGDISRPLGTAHPLVAPYQVYATATTSIAIGVLTQAHWEAFCDLAGRPSLAADARFRTAVDRIDHRAALNREIAPLLAARPAAHWLAEFARCGLVAGAVNDVAALAAHPQHAARQFFMHWPLDGGATATVPGMPWRTDHRDAPPRRLPPRLGEHTGEVLAEWLGLDAAAVAALVRDGAVAGATSR